ncbi:enhanced intracellular survival protein Eis [Streptomyces sp. NPDC056160]|uniref:GNAT family N-acetyltransferase n=1 Tax=Streptomyces sp. NPDC056160 TaxID=3345731 RepID=UPI0035E05A0B
MTGSGLAIVEADDDLWQEYDTLARRAYGHPVSDIMLLGAHADRRVAVRDRKVIAGGLGLLVPQFFGGRPVPAASMACGCVAPEERGGQLAAELTAERLGPLREQGAVLATLWTSSSGYVRRLGWEAPTQVYSWTVPTDELRRVFSGTECEITHVSSEEVRSLRNGLAGQWNGPWQRPLWWDTWQQAQHPDVVTYQFTPPGRGPAGVLSVACERNPIDGRHLVVYDFWAADQAVAAAMFGFLGRHNSRIPAVVFQRTALPPAPLLLHHLRRSGSSAARSWHPWVLRILDLCRAVQERGWSDEVKVSLPIEVVAEDGMKTERFLLRVADGKAELSRTSRDGRVTLTRGQFAVWYAGGYHSAVSAALSGVSGDQAAITQLVRATADREPWLADYF